MLPCKFSVPRVFETLCNIWTKKQRGDDIYSMEYIYEKRRKVLTWRKSNHITMLNTNWNAYASKWLGRDETRAEWMNAWERDREKLSQFSALSDEHAVHRDDSWDTQKISYFCHWVRLNLSFNVCFSFVLIFWLSFDAGRCAVLKCDGSNEWMSARDSHNINIVHSR